MNASTARHEHGPPSAGQPAEGSPLTESHLLLAPGVSVELPAGPRQICTFCVMDTTGDPGISFDAQGRCSYCAHAQQRLENESLQGSEGREQLDAMAERIREAGRGREYDCLVGLSGGADSSYACLLARDLGLRALAVHLDNGWNDELAVHNIEMLVSKLDMDLYTHVVDWDEIRDLQRSFLFASVPNVETVTDHAIVATLFKEAARRGIRYILPGTNTSTETIMPPHWGHSAMDSRHLRAVHRRFGTVPLRTYPVLGPAELAFYLFGRRIKWIPFLNYVGYDKSAAERRLADELDWRPYKRKHGESRFTRWFQEYYLVRKFHADKRRAHLSSEINSGNRGRDEALDRLSEPLYSSVDEVEADNEYVRKKLGLDLEEFEAILSAGCKTHRDYPNQEWIFGWTKNRFVRRARLFAKSLS